MGIDKRRTCTDSFSVGYRDAVLSGWFRKNGELFDGFPITREDVVLDVGCGNGGNAHFCALFGAHVVFVDINVDKVTATKRRLANSPARATTPIVSDANPLPLEDNIFSKVIATELLEHVDNPVQVLRELVRVGRPGARFLLAVPDPVAEELQKPLAAPSHFQKPNHIRIIQRDEFARLVSEGGLVIERRGSYGFYWAMWWTLFWTCNVDLSAPQHPVLDNWARTWSALLDTPQGWRVKQTLDVFMPKSQVIVARKP